MSYEKEMLNKIDKCLFEDNYEYVIMNNKTYIDIFVRCRGGDLIKRYEPETVLEILKHGIFGYLKGPNMEPAKKIMVSRSAEIGKIIATKEI